MVYVRVKEGDFSFYLEKEVTKRRVKKLKERYFMAAIFFFVMLFLEEFFLEKLRGFIAKDDLNLMALLFACACAFCSSLSWKFREKEK